MSALVPTLPDGPASTPFDAVLDALPHPVLFLGHDEEVAYANGPAKARLGADLFGLGFADLFPKAGGSLADLAEAGAPVLLVPPGGGPALRALIGPPVAGGRAVSLLPESPEGAAERDEGTGLLRRAGLEAALAAGLASGRSLAVHCLDLDRFKTVNDTLGHATGDRLIAKVADRLRSACRQTDVVARIGGDEFVVIQADIAGPAEAEGLAARFVDLLGRTYVVGGQTVNIGVSVGLALPRPGEGARDLLRNADLALHEAKRLGRGRFRRFEPGMDAALRARRDLEIDLRRALALKQFVLHYQPFLDVEAERVIGFEALLRWDHPERGRVSPAEFVPLAEETGLIVKIGEWVLRTACATAATWPDPISVAVNLSPVQFRSDTVVEMVVQALARSGLPARRLEVEITEGALMDDTAQVVKTLHALRELGVVISMDDFGTGYSSLSYLQKFPFSKIKIDRSFVQGADAGGDNEAILKAIAGLGLSLGMAITAEGVETPEQLARIRTERCTHVQGFLTGRPMPVDEVAALLATETAP